MDMNPIGALLNPVSPKDLFLDHYYFWFTLTIFRRESNPKSFFLLMTPLYFLLLYSIDPTLSAVELNHVLNLIGQWPQQWKMSFNPDPNKQAIEPLFIRKINSPNHPSLYFNNQEVCRATDHKHLGLILDTKLTFTKHIYQKISIARKGIGIIKYMSSYAPKWILDQIYKIFVRPHLDYCDIIYHFPSLTNLSDSSINLNFMMQSLESTQYKAALAVIGAWKGSSKITMYEEFGWVSLSDRRWFRRLGQFYLKETIPKPRTFFIWSTSGKCTAWNSLSNY